MEKKDFPKGTKPREIFVYTCERIAEPLIPLGYKYRKSKNDIYKKDGIFVFSFYFSPSIRFGSTTFTAFFDNDIYKKDGIFVFSFYFSPSIRFGSTTFTAFFDVSSPVIAQLQKRRHLCVLLLLFPLHPLWLHHFYCLLRCEFPGDCPVAQ